MRALWLVVAAAAAARPPTRWLASRGGAKKTVEEDEPASIRLEVDAAVEDAADFDASGIELPEGQMDACGVFEGDVVEVSGAKGAHTLCVVKQREEDGDACALGRLARQNAAARVGGVVTVTPPSEGAAAATHVCRGLPRLAGGRGVQERRLRPGIGRKVPRARDWSEATFH